jgi:hypothetical protein
MAIPRLPPSANPYELNVTVNIRLRPYFEIWFQRKKEPGETPEQFALRVLKTAALNDYLTDTGKAEMDAIEAAKETAITELNADVTAIATEVD